MDQINESGEITVVKPSHYLLVLNQMNQINLLFFATTSKNIMNYKKNVLFNKQFAIMIMHNKLRRLKEYISLLNRNELIEKYISLLNGNELIEEYISLLNGNKLIEATTTHSIESESTDSTYM